MTAFTSNWFVFFPLAFSLFVAIRLAEGSVDRGQSQFGLLVIRSLIGLLFLFSIFAVGLRTSLLGLCWILLLVVFTAVIVWKNRRLDRSAWLLTALHAKGLKEQNLVCDVFQTQNRGWVKRKARGLRRDLAQGYAWWDSIETQGIAQGVYQKLAVRLVARYGSRNKADSKAFEHSEVLAPLHIEAEAERLLGRLMIFSWVVFVAPVIVSMMIFIVPTFQQMFQEFGMELPPVMRSVIAVADNAANFGWASLMILVPLAWLLLLGVGCLLWIFPHLLQLPLLRWLSRDYYRNLGFIALAHAAEQEPNLIQACQVAGKLVSVEDMSAQYARAADLLASGMQPREAFLQAKLLSRSEFAAFGLGFDQRDPAWSLQQLASWKTARMLNRYSMLVQIGVVVLTLGIAVVVGGLAVGVFQVLSTLISSLA